MNTTWTVRVERLEVQLPVGIHPDELEPQPVWISLAATGTAPASPRSIDQCFDYEPLCRWLTHDGPRTPHTPLVEAGINQLLGFVFDLDDRLERVWVGLYKQLVSRNAVAGGIERQVTRFEFKTQLRHVAADIDVAAGEKTLSGGGSFAASQGE